MSDIVFLHKFSTIGLQFYTDFALLSVCSRYLGLIINLCPSTYVITSKPGSINLGKVSSGVLHGAMQCLVVRVVYTIIQAMSVCIVSLNSVATSSSAYFAHGAQFQPLGSLSKVVSQNSRQLFVFMLRKLNNTNPSWLRTAVFSPYVSELSAVTDTMPKFSLIQVSIERRSFLTEMNMFSFAQLDPD